MVLPGFFQSFAYKLLHRSFDQVFFTILIVLGDQILEALGKFHHIQVTAFTVKDPGKHSIGFTGFLGKIAIKIYEGITQIEQNGFDFCHLAH